MKTITRGIIDPYIVGTLSLDGSGETKWETMPGGPCEIETDSETGAGEVRLLEKAPRLIRE